MGRLDERVGIVTGSASGIGRATAHALAREGASVVVADIDEAGEIKNTEIVEELSLPPVKIHCSVLAEDAIKSAIADYKQKNTQGDDS